MWDWPRQSRTNAVQMGLNHCTTPNTAQPLTRELTETRTQRYPQHGGHSINFMSADDTDALAVTSAVTDASLVSEYTAHALSDWAWLGDLRSHSYIADTPINELMQRVSGRGAESYGNPGARSAYGKWEKGMPESRPSFREFPIDLNIRESSERAVGS